MRRLLIFMALFLCAAPALGANVYIRKGAAGSADGSDWTNALTDLPATFVRGNTYFVADGTYGIHIFSTAVSDTTSIVIRKATMAVHGTETGWDNAYGAGQAVFTGDTTSPGAVFVVTTNNWIFDGAPTNATADSTGQGIKILSANAGHTCVTLRDTPTWAGNPPDTLLFQGIEFAQKGVDTEDDDDCLQVITANPAGEGTGPRNVTIKNCWFHDSGRVFIYTVSTRHWLVEHNYFSRNSSSNEAHGEGWASYGCDSTIVRYNIWADVEGTANIALMGNETQGNTLDEWKIYGNLFYYSYGNPFSRSGTSNGVIGGQSGCTITNLRVYNNTFISQTGLNSGFNFSAGSENVAYNNIWWNCDNIGALNITHDYNQFVSSDLDVAASAHETVDGDSTLFTDVTANTFTLAAQTSPGTTLASPYDVDRAGVAYNVNGSWSMGYAPYGTGAADEDKTWYVDRGKSDAGAGTKANPLQVSQVADSLSNGDTLIDITSVSTGANPITIAADSVTVQGREYNGDTPVAIGGLKSMTMTNLNTSVSDSVMIAANGDDSFFSEGGSTGWSSTYNTTGGVMLWGEVAAGKRTNVFLGFNNVDAVTSGDVITNVTAATLRVFALAAYPSFNYEIRGITSLNVTAPTDSNTFKALYDTLSVGAETGTLAMAAGDTVWYDIDVTDVVNGVLGQASFSSKRVGLMLLTDTAGANGHMRFESYENAGSNEARLYYTYGTASNYYAAELTGEEVNISRVYRYGVLMTFCATLGDVNTTSEYFISADRDSLYVYGNGENVTADAYGPQWIISGAEVTLQWPVVKYGSISGAIRVTGNNVNVYNGAVDSSAVGIVALADSIVVKNCVISASDTAWADNGVGSIEDYNAWIDDVPGSPGAHDIISADDWATKYAVPPETWRDRGIYVGLSFNGTAPEIGPVELAALVASGYTRRVIWPPTPLYRKSAGGRMIYRK